VTLQRDHARHRLDDLLLNPVRLSIMAALASVEEAEFGIVRDMVEISDSALSKQVAALHPYVLMRKGYVGKRPRSWLRLSRQGRKAYERHLEALREIAGD
jgi:hypothetical protein